MCQTLKPCKVYGEILLNQSVVLKDDTDVDLKLHLEVVCLQGRTGKQPREDHVHGDGHTAADISFTNLDILDFSSIFGESFSTSAGFHSDKLDVNGADRCGCTLHNHRASEVEILSSHYTLSVYAVDEHRLCYLLTNGGRKGHQIFTLLYVVSQHSVNSAMKVWTLYEF